MVCKRFYKKKKKKESACFKLLQAFIPDLPAGYLDLPDAICLVMFSKDAQGTSQNRQIYVEIKLHTCWVSILSTD